MDIKYVYVDYYNVDLRGFLREKNLSNIFIIQQNGWNDYGYEIAFSLYFFTEKKALIDLGMIRIAREGDDDFLKKTDLGFSHGEFFDCLSEEYYSILNPIAYEFLFNLVDEIREQVLEDLRDVAYDEKKLERVRHDPIFQKSFLRTTTFMTFKNVYVKMARGEVDKEKFDVTYISENSKFNSEIRLRLTVDPESQLPSNLHALIGSNGAGKTQLMKDMIETVIQEDNNKSSNKGYFYDHLVDSKQPFKNVFSNLIFFNFSNFDDLDHIKLPKEERNGLVYSVTSKDIMYTFSEKNLKFDDYGVVGKNFGKDDSLAPDFRDSLYNILAANAADAKVSGEIKKNRNKEFLTKKLFNETMKILSYDKTFIYYIDKMEIKNSCKKTGIEEKIGRILSVYNEMSSGHKSIFYTVVMLLDVVSEGSFIIFDEPENHLHPPLLSSFINIVSYIVESLNGLALMLTHSPIVLQEIPSKCVNLLERDLDNNHSSISKINTNTYASNFDRLVEQVFRYEYQETGYYSKLSRLMETESYDIDAVIDLLDGEIGSRGLDLLFAMKLNHESESGKTLCDNDE